MRTHGSARRRVRWSGSSPSLEVVRRGLVLRAAHLTKLFAKPFHFSAQTDYLRLKRGYLFSFALFHTTTLGRSDENDKVPRTDVRGTL